MLRHLPYLSLSEAAEYCGYSESQLLRLAEKGPEYLELLSSIGYEEMGFGPGDIPMDSGDTEHFLAIPCTHIKELTHRGQTSVQTFLVPQTLGRTAVFLDIHQRLSMKSPSGEVNEIRCKSERIVKKDDLYIGRECLDRVRRGEEGEISTPTYLTLKHAAELYGRNTDQILMEAAKGVERIELLYWVQYKEIHRDNEYRQFEGINATGDYLVLSKERIVELRHQKHTATDCFLYPTRSPMQEATKQLRREKNCFNKKPEKDSDFLRCETIFVIFPKDSNLVVTAADLDRIWSRNNKGNVKAEPASAEETTERQTEAEDIKYPTELRVALEAEEKFSSKTGVCKTRGVIQKYVKERLVEIGGVPVTDTTCRRIAELVTCDEMSIVLDAYKAVYGQNSEATRPDVELYLQEHHELQPTSNAFRRIAAVTTPDNRKKSKK